MARWGIHSGLSLPLLTADGVIGAVTIYAHCKNAFDDRAEELGRLFAAPAAVAAQNAQLIARTQRLATHLQKALTDRRIIERAVGIIMSRGGVTAAEAFGRIQMLSQRENVKVVEFADNVVQQAVRRARARHCGTS